MIFLEGVVTFLCVAGFGISKKVFGFLPFVRLWILENSCWVLRIRHYDFLGFLYREFWNLVQWTLQILGCLSCVFWFRIF